MLNEEKVALMTKMALYEQGEGRKSIPMSKYYRSDYLSLRLLNSVILVSVAYALIGALVVLVNFEWILENLVHMDLVLIGKRILISYLVAILLYAVLTYVIYAWRFKKCRKGLNEYNGNLKQLYAINRQEEKEKKYEAGGY